MKRIPSLLFSAATHAAKQCLVAFLAVGLVASTSYAVDWTTGAPNGFSPGGGLNFDGGTGEFSFVNVPGLDMNSEINPGNYTMAAWISPDVIPGENFFLGQTQEGIHIGLRDGGKLHQAHWGNDYSATTVVPFGDPADADNWVHALFTWDDENFESAIYYDGELDGEAFDKASPNGGGNFVIGTRNGNGGPAFEGQMDDVAVWTEVLSEDDIMALAGGANPMTIGSPLGYWNFEDDQNEMIAADLSGNDFEGSFSVKPPPIPRPDPIAKLEGPIFIGNINETTGALIDDRDLLYEALDDGSFDAESDDVEVLLIDDHNLARGCPFNERPDFHDALTAEDAVPQWPNTAGNIDNFASLILGQFTVNDGDGTAGEDLTISVHLDSDDGGSFRVVGSSFEDVSDGTLEDFDGDDAMHKDGNVCNNNFTGLITLSEGVVYDFEAIEREAGGDAGIQVLFALGDQIDEPDDGLYNVLAMQTTVSTPGDYNNDGVIDAADADLQSVAMKDANPDLAVFDENGDGAVNVTDRNIWVKDHARTWIGDANLDGEFQSGDFVQVFTAGLYDKDEMAGWVAGDWNGDMRFNSGDFVAAFTDGGYDAGLLPAAAAVPEPSSIVLALISLLGLVGIARRRNA